MHQVQSLTEIARVLGPSDSERARHLRTLPKPRPDPSIIPVTGPRPSSWSLASSPPPDPERAERIARSIDDGNQTTALVMVAGVVATSDPHRAKRLVCKGLSRREWMRFLAPLATVNPTALASSAVILQGDEPAGS